MMDLGDLRAVFAATAIAWLCLAGSIAAAEEPRTASAAIGDLTLQFDPKVWRIEGEGDRLLIGWVEARDPRYGIDVSIDTGSADGCSTGIVRDRAGLAYTSAWDSFVTTLERPGFDLHVATVEMGCRNWTGSPVFACAAYEDKLYSFIADPGGCRHIGPQYDGFVIDLLRGLREP
jgi:hypothetical protein